MAVSLRSKSHVEQRSGLYALCEAICNKLRQVCAISSGEMIGSCTIAVHPVTLSLHLFDKDPNSNHHTATVFSVQLTDLPGTQNEDQKSFVLYQWRKFNRMWQSSTRRGPQKVLLAMVGLLRQVNMCRTAVCLNTGNFFGPPPYTITHNNCIYVTGVVIYIKVCSMIKNAF
jgi:hypothetical protein